MAQLMVMRRQGLIVVSGTVTDYSLPRGEIAIENDCYLPVSQATEKRRVRFRINRGEIERFRIREGVFLIATVKPTVAMELLFDGGEDDTKEYLTTGYHMRYTGAFDFEPRGSAPEQHVFRAAIAGSTLSRNANGTVFTVTEVYWQKNGQRLSRKLLARGDVRDKMDEIGSGIFVTGGEYGEYFPLTRVVCP